MSKLIKARIQLKCDTEENWNTASNSENPFVPLLNEFIGYRAPTENGNIGALIGYKMGDGITPVADLPFVSISAELTDEQMQEIANIIANGEW